MDLWNIDRHIRHVLMEEPFVPFDQDKENDSFGQVGTSSPSSLGNAGFCLSTQITERGLLPDLTILNSDKQAINEGEPSTGYDD